MDNVSVTKSMIGVSGGKSGVEATVEPATAEKSRTRSSTDLSSPPTTGLYERVFFLLITIVLFMGWRVQNEEYLTAESGLGYAYGVVGGGMMLLLLLYPLRKRMRMMQTWGAVKYWFQIHMLLGIVGPVLILFHCNFRTGSMNSSVALWSMVVVAVSGIVGRYIYTKIHYGLYGRQMSLKELKEQIEDNMNSVSSVMGYAPKVRERLLAFDAAVLRPRYSLMQSLWRFLIIGFWARWNRFVLKSALKRALKVAAAQGRWSRAELKRQRQEGHDTIATHIAMAFRITKFSVFERAFALWHLFHLPLTFILMIAVAAHIVAVHLY